jgi:hypothetical protein
VFLTLIPATIVAALASEAQDATAVGNIDLAIWLCIAPLKRQGPGAAHERRRASTAQILSRVLALTLCCTGVTMLNSALV